MRGTSVQILTSDEEGTTTRGEKKPQTNSAVKRLGRGSPGKRRPAARDKHRRGSRLQRPNATTRCAARALPQRREMHSRCQGKKRPTTPADNRGARWVATVLLLPLSLPATLFACPSFLGLKGHAGGTRGVSKQASNDSAAGGWGCCGLVCVARV